MKFKGAPLSQVRWKDKVIVIFDDNGQFETEDAGIILRLKLCDFLPVVEVQKETEVPVVPTEEPEVKAPEDKPKKGKKK